MEGVENDRFGGLVDLEVNSDMALIGERLEGEEIGERYGIIGRFDTAQLVSVCKV